MTSAQPRRFDSGAFRKWQRNKALCLTINDIRNARHSYISPDSSGHGSSAPAVAGEGVTHDIRLCIAGPAICVQHTAQLHFETIAR